MGKGVLKMRLIVDHEQYNYFTTKVLPPLAPDEVYFVSMSARNKYLTTNEREYYALGRTEMYARLIIRSKTGFDYGMTKLGALDSVRLTKNNMPIPEKAKVVYVNVNPSSSLKACLLFDRETAKMTSEILVAGLNGKSANLTGFAFADRKLMNCFQKATGTRHWLDVDIDSTDNTLVTMLRGELNVHQITHYVVKTRSGWHVLIARTDLNGTKYRLHETVTRLNNAAKTDGGEVVFNNNAMLPLPGTLQGGFLVHFD